MMRKIAFLAFAFALCLVALPGFAADAADTEVSDTVTLDQLFAEEVQPEAAEAEATEVAPDGSEPLFVAGDPCGDVVCGKGTYCCNASCGWCRPPGMSCIQIACN